VAVIAASTTRSGVVYGTEGGAFNMTSLLRSTNGGVQWTSVLNPGPIVGLLPGASANDVFVFATQWQPVALRGRRRNVDGDRDDGKSALVGSIAR
jgi:hypothetical protein